jgi:hypothetical protein
MAPNHSDTHNTQAIAEEEAMISHTLYRRDKNILVTYMHKGLTDRVSAAKIFQLLIFAVAYAVWGPYVYLVMKGLTASKINKVCI